MTTNKIVIGILAAVTGIALFSNSSANAENNLSSTVSKSETQTAEAVFSVSKEENNKTKKKYKYGTPLEKDELIKILKSVGFEGYALKGAWATVMKESMGTPNSWNPNRNTGDNSYGLFQINMLGSMGQDIFNGWHGNALKAFYLIFTPEYIIKELSERINEKSEMRCEALKMIYEDNSIFNELKRKMYTVNKLENNALRQNMNDINDEIFNYGYGITVEYVRYLLLKMHIIIQKSKNEVIIDIN